MHFVYNKSASCCYPPHFQLVSLPICSVVMITLVAVHVPLSFPCIVTTTQDDMGGLVDEVLTEKDGVWVSVHADAMQCHARATY